MTSYVTLFRRKVFQFCMQAYRCALYHFWGMVKDTITIRTIQGTFAISTRESDIGIGCSLYVNRQFEYDFSLRAVKQLKDNGFLNSIDVEMLDIGANIGVIGIGLLVAGEVTHVVAVEPEPGNFRLLRKNIESNALTGRMICLQIAVGEEESILTMELSPSNAGDHRIRCDISHHATERDNESARTTIRVPSLSLPQILKRSEVSKMGFSSPSLLWIDVQGYEGYVFKGAGSVLKAGLPTVSEIWPYGILRAGMELNEFAQIVASIWTHYWVERRDRFIKYPMTVFDRYLDELGNDGYFENVIFTRESR